VADRAAAAAAAVALVYHDPEHGPVMYRYTRAERVADCDYCAAGTCIQRVEACDAWEGCVVVHTRAADLS
jgi:hypothetical protein